MPDEGKKRKRMPLATTITAPPRGDPPPPGDAFLQAHFHAPPEPTTGPPGQGAAPSLVTTCVTHEETPDEQCPNGAWCRGTCEAHGNTHWIYIPCKKRTCPICGVKRRQKIAWRISHGIEALSGKIGGAWFVGTWTYDISKPDAVKAQARFIAWLRRRLGYPIQYAATWERTRKRRLHLNLVLAPWTYIPQAELSAAWQRVGGGHRVWIKRVGVGIGIEAAKSRRRISAYFAKWEQMVPDKKGATYSKQWPKLPDSQPTERKGAIQWDHEWQLEREGPTLALFSTERHLGHWYQNQEGEYAYAYDTPCDCFHCIRLHLPGLGPGPDPPPEGG